MENKMSFSTRVKRELEEKIPAARHCQLAELAAVMLFDAKHYIDENGREILLIRAEQEGTVRKCFTILQKAFNIERDTGVVCDKQSILVTDADLIRRVLQAVKQWDESRSCADVRLLTSDCCRRAFIRGCFLAAGSVSTPEKFYHLEIVCAGQALAEQIQTVLHSFEVDAKIVLRKKYHVVYVKEGDQISEIFGLMEAPRAVMDFENVRILKDVRNRVNRSVNCETANIHKTASAAASQLEAILFIRDQIGLESLPEGLWAVANARLEMPEASLAELGESLHPPVGKSGVNHRLRKIKALADQYRVNKEEK